MTAQKGADALTPCVKREDFLQCTRPTSCHRWCIKVKRSSDYYSGDLTIFSYVVHTSFRQKSGVLSSPLRS